MGMIFHNVTIGEPCVSYDSTPSEALVIIHNPTDKNYRITD